MALVRPGIINLDFKDVSQMAKDIDANNPLKNLIAVGGKVLSDRERDILYRRALAQSQGLEAPNEKTAFEFIKENGGNALENIKNFSLNSYDKVKNLIAPEMIEYSKEVGEKKVTPVKVYGDGNAKPIPDPNGNAVLVEFPTTEINNSKNLRAPISKIIGDKVDWESPRNGYKTEFPTTIVGTKLVSPENLNKSNENLKSNENNISKDNKSNENKSNNSMAAWSEMYRLSPERAAFDYTRVKNDYELSQQLAIKAQELAIKAKDKSMSTEELQQLWKDNTRALSEARKIQDPIAIQMYQDNLSRLTPILQERNPAIWGKKEDVDNSDKTDKTTNNEEINNNKSAALNESYNVINTLIDKDNNGVADNKQTVSRELLSIQKKYNLSDIDMQDAIKDFNSKLEDIKSNYEANNEINNQNRTIAAQQFTQNSDFLPSVATVKSIQADPKNQTNIQLGVSELLKILSGTGVSDSERMNTILSLTPTEYQNDIRSKATQLGKAFVDKFLKMDNVALAEYATHVNPNLIAKELKKRIPKQAWEWSEKNMIHEKEDKPSKKEEAKSGRFSKFGKTK